LIGVLEEIGYNAIIVESVFTDCLRMEAVKWACFIGEKVCREKANFLMIKDLIHSDDM